MPGIILGPKNIAVNNTEKVSGIKNLGFLLIIHIEFWSREAVYRLLFFTCPKLLKPYEYQSNKQRKKKKAKKERTKEKKRYEGKKEGEERKMKRKDRRKKGRE